MKPSNSVQHNERASSMALSWLVWSLGTVFYFYEFLLQVSPSVMSHELMHDFSITGQTLGVLVGLYFYSYAAMQLPGGLLMDRFGPHRLLTLATLICALSTLAFGITDHFLTACIARFMIGLGSAFAAVGSMKLAASWFAPDRFAFLTGLMVTVGMLGAIGGEGPLAWFIDHVGWRNSMLYLGAAGLVIAVLIYFIAQDAPKQCTMHHATHKHEERFIVKLLALIGNGQLWLIAIYGGLMYLSTPVFCGLWGVPYLILKLHVSKAVAANYISLIFIGWAVAGPVWGIISNKMGKRKTTLYWATIGALLTLSLFLYAPLHAGILIQALLFLFGIFSAGFLPAFALAKEICSQSYVATSLSFMNMMNMIGVALIQPFIGFVLDHFWQGQWVNGVRFYSLETYQIALLVLPIAVLLSLLLLPFIQETYCRQASK